MAQSSSIAFALVAGFVVYITVRGELPAYLCVIGIGSNCPAPPATPVNTGNPSGTQSPVINVYNEIDGTTGASSNSVTSNSTITAPPNSGVESVNSTFTPIGGQEQGSQGSDGSYSCGPSGTENCATYNDPGDDNDLPVLTYTCFDSEGNLSTCNY